MAVYDDIADHYDATRGGEVRGDEFAAIVDRRLPLTGGAVLDIGAGTGVVALGLHKRGRRVLGIDISVPMLRRAQGRLGGRVLAADGRCLPLGTSSVDHAVSVWVVHHLEDPVPLFTEVRRVLRPGGRYIVCPNYRITGGDPVGPIVRSMHERARALGAGWQAAPMGAPAILRLATDAGFSGEIEVVESQPRETTVAEEIEAIRNRAYPALVGLDGDALGAVAGPALAALADLPRGRIVRSAVTDVVMLKSP